MDKKILWEQKTTYQILEKPIFLTTRDLNILQFIGLDGIASLENLHFKFWPYGSAKTCRGRLSVLEKDGWLKSHFVHVCRPGQLVFTLTPKTAKEHFSQVARKNLMVGLPAHHEIKQQLLAQKARLTLETQLAAQGKYIVEWQNERQLRRVAFRNIKTGKTTLISLNEIADARMIVKDSNGQISQQEIEIDGEYYGQMLKNKILGYARKASPTLWVTTHKRAARIKNEISGANATNITLLILDDV